MPYIIMRRTDIPNGVLQVDDLKPNDSQRNYTLDPPGQSGYVRDIPTEVPVLTTGAGPILTVRDSCGLGSYFVDNVEDFPAGTGLTAAVGNAAAVLVIGRAEGGLSLTLADVNAALIAAGAGATTDLEGNASTGLLTEVLSILSGAKYQLPAGSEVALAAAAFNPARQGFFATLPGVKNILATGAFNVSNGAGDLFNYKRADFEYNGVIGPALTVLADNGAVL
jgi:hypothetical protein